MFVNGKEMYKFKDDNKIFTFLFTFVLDAFPKKNGKAESEEVPFKQKFMIFQSIAILLIHLKFSSFTNV